MKNDEHNCNNIFKLLNYILTSNYAFFTLKKLVTESGLTFGQVRTLVAVLKETNIVYTIDRVGLFLNKSFMETIDFNNMQIEFTEKEIIFVSKKLYASFLNIPDFDCYDFLYDQNISNVIKYLFLFIFLEKKYNLFYEKEILVNEDNINVIRIGKSYSKKKVNETIIKVVYVGCEFHFIT